MPNVAAALAVASDPVDGSLYDIEPAGMFDLIPNAGCAQATMSPAGGTILCACGDSVSSVLCAFQGRSQLYNVTVSVPGIDDASTTITSITSFVDAKSGVVQALVTSVDSEGTSYLQSYAAGSGTALWNVTIAPAWRVSSVAAPPYAQSIWVFLYQDSGAATVLVLDTKNGNLSASMDLFQRTPVAAAVLDLNGTTAYVVTDQNGYRQVEALRMFANNTVLRLVSWEAKPVGSFAGDVRLSVGPLDGALVLATNRSVFMWWQATATASASPSRTPAAAPSRTPTATPAAPRPAGAFTVRVYNDTGACDAGPARGVPVPLALNGSLASRCVSIPVPQGAASMLGVSCRKAGTTPPSWVASVAVFETATCKGPSTNVTLADGVCFVADGVTFDVAAGCNATRASPAPSPSLTPSIALAGKCTVENE